MYRRHSAGGIAGLSRDSELAGLVTCIVFKLEPIVSCLDKRFNSITVAITMFARSLLQRNARRAFVRGFASGPVRCGTLPASHQAVRPHTFTIYAIEDQNADPAVLCSFSLRSLSRRILRWLG